jgi:hypothetical protein
MVNDNRDSLRAQITAAMDAYASTRGWADRSAEFNTEMFDQAIMPVLDAAMKAGELLLHRATKPQLPVSDSIKLWLEMTCASIIGLRAAEKTVGRRELLETLYHIHDSAEVALGDVRVMANHQGSAGNPLAGITLPTKG